MKRCVSTILILSCSVILFLLCAQIGAGQKNRSSKPPRSKANVSRTEKDLAEFEKRRKEIHRLLLSGKYQREDVAELLQIGDRTSIPGLLEVLKDNPVFVRANGRVVLPLKTFYAVEALKKITGLNIGATYKEWNEWWEKDQKYYIGK
jgi:hypothetical protein